MSITNAVSLTPLLIHRGVELYQHSYDAMRVFTDARNMQTDDQLWLVEHPPVYTLGLGADPGHILEANDIPVIQTDRGGEVTYHGPGQAVIYLMMDLRRHRSDTRIYAREFVRRIEQAVIDTLGAYNLPSERQPGAPGIYMSDGDCKGAKIAALGLKIRANGCTYHGVALNVDMDLEPFSRINPCGYEGLRTVDMKTAGIGAQMQAVQELLADNLIEQLKG